MNPKTINTHTHQLNLILPSNAKLKEICGKKISIQRSENKHNDLFNVKIPTNDIKNIYENILYFLISDLKKEINKIFEKKREKKLKSLFVCFNRHQNTIPLNINYDKNNKILIIKLDYLELKYNLELNTKISIPKNEQINFLLLYPNNNFKIPNMISIVKEENSTFGLRFYYDSKIQSYYHGFNNIEVIEKKKNIQNYLLMHIKDF